MTKTSLSYTDVAPIAAAFHRAGICNPGAREIRDELIKVRGPHASIGSMTTIQRHLQRWRDEERPRDPDVPTPQLPSPVSDALISWVKTAVARAESPLLGQLDQVRNELSVAVQEGGYLEERLDTSIQDLEARTCERDQARGEMSALRFEADALRAELGRAREQGVALSRDLAAAQTESKALTKRVEELHTEADRLGAACRAEVQSLNMQLVSATAERNDAREARATAAAALEAAIARAQQAEARECTLQVEVKQLRGQVGKLTSDLAAAKDRSFDSQVRVVELNAELNALKLPLAGIGEAGSGETVANEAKKSAPQSASATKLEKSDGTEGNNSGGKEQPRIAMGAH